MRRRSLMNSNLAVQFRASVVRRELGLEEDRRRLEYLQSIPLKDALALIHDNEIDSVRFDAVIFGMGENSHFIRPEPGSEDAIVGTFNGVPFMFDHELSMDSKKGRLQGPRRVGTSPETFQAEVVLVDPRAMEDAVRGKIEEFSAGVRGSAFYCSVCEQDWEKVWFWYVPSCKHELGEKYVKDDDTVVVAEAFIRDPEGYECSAVWKGAYPGTGILFSDLDEETRNRFMEFVMAGKDEEKAVNEQTELDGAEANEESPEVDVSTEADESSEGGEQDFAASSERDVLLKKLFNSQFSLAVRDRKVTEKHRSFFEKWTARAGIELLEEFTAIGNDGPAKVQENFSGTSSGNNGAAIPAAKEASLTERVKARRKASNKGKE